ncbi:MAG TPA: hypothetical protein DIW47_04155 [Bacteroidetes bacterium]|nr:hypothetical protein [Bacteroidota bacterium]
MEFLIERNATPINSDPIVGSLPDVNDYTGHGLIDADATIGNFRYPITRIYHSNAPTSKSFTHNSGETVSFEKNAGDFEAGVPYTAERREIVFTFEIQFDPTTEIIEFWPRYYNCVGVSDNNLISKEYHAQFDSPILGSNEITVMAVANTWYFPTLSPPQWYPVHPDQVRVAFSLLIQDVTLGVNNLNSEGDFRIYPNPAGAEFSIDLGDLNDDCEKIELYSIEGKQVYSRNISKTDAVDKYTISTRNLNNGVYVCRVFTSEGILESKLVIVN